MRRGLSSLEGALIGIVIVLAIVAGVQSVALYSAVTSPRTQTITEVATSLSVSTIISTSTSTVTITSTSTLTPSIQVATAQVSASAVSCNNTNGECQILLTNTGNAAATPNACSFTGNVAGVGAMGTTKGPPPTTAPTSIPGGGSETIYCQDAGTAGAGSGIAVSGEITLSNSDSVIFSGTWQ